MTCPLDSERRKNREDLKDNLTLYWTGTPLWYAKVGLPSLLSAGMVQIKDNYDHHSFYSEINANDLSYKYFYKTFDWNKSSEWDMLRFPLYDALPEPLVAPNDVYNTLFY